MSGLSKIGTARVNETEISRYADLVLGYCEGFVPVRLIPEKGTAPAKPWTDYLAVNEGLDVALCKLAHRAWAASRGLFIVPCTVNETGSARSEDIAETCVIPVDLDLGPIQAKQDHLERILGPASLVVASGGLTESRERKLHLYWRLTEAARGDDLHLIERLRQSIVEAVGADASFRRLTQPIRAAGSVHGKFGVHTPVQILATEGGEYDLGDLAEQIASLRPFPGLASSTRTPNQRVRFEDLQKMRVRSEGKDGTTRFDAISSTIGHWVRLVRLGWATLEEARSAVTDYNQARIDPPWAAKKLDREFEALMRKDKATYPEAWASREHATATEPVDASEDALAAEFVRREGTSFRYTSAWGAWSIWTGQVWQKDDSRKVTDVIRHVCRDVAVRRNSSEARKLSSARTIAAVEKIATSDRAIAVTPSAWDPSVNLLNTPSGVLDLETGELLAHEPGLMMTQITSASLGSSCPRWRAFLSRISERDEELQKYLARLCGYCLTGDTSEHAFFFLWGSGANGKSAFLQTVAKVLGTYAASAPLESFMSSGSSSHPTDLAGLRGKRFVCVSETEPGRSWAESRIKQITGGDTLRVRHLYRDFFEFTPTFKLLVAGNHRPQLTGVGEAMRRRLQLIPFTVTIPDHERDRELPKKLLQEMDGILGWMLDGLADWRERGLAPPKRVTDASRSYFEEEDLVGQWIVECCDQDPLHRAPASALYDSWSGWAERAGVEKGSQKSLGEALRGHGFTSFRTSRGRGWKGLTPKSPSDRSVT